MKKVRHYLFYNHIDVLTPLTASDDLKLESLYESFASHKM